MATKPDAHESERRSEQRRNLLFATTGSVGGEDVQPVLVRDISANGLLVETDMELPLGTTLMLELPEAGQVAAKVVWEGDKLAGCRLEGSVSQATIDTVRDNGEAAHAGGEDDAPAPRTTATTLAKRLQELRIERDLTRAELAERAGISTPSIWAWETGRTVPRLQSLETLAEGLGVPVSELQIGAMPGQIAPIDASVWQSTSSSDTLRGDLRSQRLSELVEASRLQIAAVAGTTPERIHITIEL